MRCVTYICTSDVNIRQCFWRQCFRIRKRQTHRKVATQSLRSKEPRLYDSGTAVIQSLHRTVSARVVSVSQQRLGGEQVMTMYHSNAVSPGGAGIRYTG